MNSARTRIGSYDFRDPDYRQVLLWADALGLEPAEIIHRLETSTYEWMKSGVHKFRVEGGSIISLVWDFDRLPLSEFEWVDGLAIRGIFFTHPPKAPPNISLRIPSLALLECSGMHLRNLSMTMRHLGTLI